MTATSMSRIGEVPAEQDPVLRLLGVKVVLTVVTVSVTGGRLVLATVYSETTVTTAPPLVVIV